MTARGIDASLRFLSDEDEGQRGGGGKPYARRGGKKTSGNAERRESDRSREATPSANVKRSEKHGAPKPRKPRMLRLDVDEDRVEEYCVALREHQELTRVYDYHAKIVDKCDESQLLAFMARVLKSVIDNIVEENTAHGQYLAKATLRCDVGALHILDAFCVTLYKKAEEYNKYSPDLLLLESVMSDSRLNQDSDLAVDMNLLAIEFGFNARLCDCLKRVIEDMAEKQGLTEADKARLLRRWRLWLKNKSFDDCRPNPFNHAQLSTYVEPPYTINYQLHSNESGVFACLTSDQINPFAMQCKTLGEAPKNAPEEIDIYDSKTKRGKTFQEIVDILQKIIKSPRATQGAQKAKDDNVFRFQR